MKYKNPRYKKIKKSYLLIISCGFCKFDILLYQKVGKGNVLKMHIERIVEGEIDFNKGFLKVLNCPNCNEELGTRVVLKQREKEVYKVIRGRINTRKIIY